MSSLHFVHPWLLLLLTHEVKSGDGSRGFKWHQDIQGWPHTDYSPVTIGIYIDGCTPEQGPLYDAFNLDLR